MKALRAGRIYGLSHKPCTMANPLPAKEVPKEERAILALECMDLLRLFTKSKKLGISVQEFVQIAKLLELQKRFAATLSDLASDPQFQRYYEALQPAQKKGAVNASKPEANVIASSELLTEASKLRDAIDRVVKAIENSDRMIAPDPADDIDPEQYHDLADLLLIDRARHGKSIKTEPYGSPPIDLTAVSYRSRSVNSRRGCMVVAVPKSADSVAWCSWCGASIACRWSWLA